MLLSRSDNVSKSQLVVFTKDCVCKTFLVAISKDSIASLSSTPVVMAVDNRTLTEYDGAVEGAILGVADGAVLGLADKVVEREKRGAWRAFRRCSRKAFTFTILGTKEFHSLVSVGYVFFTSPLRPSSHNQNLYHSHIHHVLDWWVFPSVHL